MPEIKKNLSPVEREKKRVQYVEDYLVSQMDVVIAEIDAARFESALELYDNSIDYPGLKERAKDLRIALKEYREQPSSPLKREALMITGKAFLSFINEKGETVKQKLPRQVRNMEFYLEYLFNRDQMKKEVLKRFVDAVDEQTDLYDEVSKAQVTKKKTVIDENGMKRVVLQKRSIQEVVTEEAGIMKKAIEVFNSTKEHFNSKEYEAMKKEAKEYARKLNTLKKYLERKAFINLPKKLEELDNHREALQYRIGIYLKKKEKEFEGRPDLLEKEVRYLSTKKLLEVGAKYKAAVSKALFGRRSSEIMRMKQENLTSVQSWRKNKEGFDAMMAKLEEADPALTISSEQFKNFKKAVKKLQEEEAAICAAKEAQGEAYDWRTAENGETKKRITGLLHTVYTLASVYLVYKGDPKPGLEEKRVAIAKQFKAVAEEQLSDIGRMEQKESAIRQNDLNSFFAVQKDQAEDDLCDMEMDYVQAVRQKADAARDALIQLVNGEDMASDPRRPVSTNPKEMNRIKAGKTDYADEDTLRMEVKEVLSRSGIEEKMGKGQIYLNNAQLKQFLLQEKTVELAFMQVAPEMVTVKEWMEKHNGWERSL